MLHSHRSVLFTKSCRQLFLDRALGCSMINENLISLCLDPKLKEERGNRCASPEHQNSPEISQCLRARVRMPWLAFKALLVWPQTTISMFSDFKPLYQPNVFSLTQWALPILFLRFSQQAMPTPPNLQGPTEVLVFHLNSAFRSFLRPSWSSKLWPSDLGLY